MNRDPRKLTEEQIHISIVHLLLARGHPKLIWHHPANGELRAKRTAWRLKRMGVKPGVADFALTLPDGRSAFLEVKAPAGRQSLVQKAFQAQCEANGVPYTIVRSSYEAETVLACWNALNLTQRKAA